MHRTALEWSQTNSLKPTPEMKGLASCLASLVITRHLHRGLQFLLGRWGGHVEEEEERGVSIVMLRGFPLHVTCRNGLKLKEFLFLTQQWSRELSQWSTVRHSLRISRDYSLLI